MSLLNIKRGYMKKKVTEYKIVIHDPFTKKKHVLFETSLKKAKQLASQYYCDEHKIIKIVYTVESEEVLVDTAKARKERMKKHGKV